MKSNTSKIVKWIFLSPVILILLAVAFCEVNKAYWDHQVRLMCEKDGGVTVYEKVYLTKNEYEKLSIPFEKMAGINPKYYRVSLEDKVINENPFVWKGGQKIVRSIDKKILGVQINYSRRGGDFPTGIIHESHFGCSQVSGVNQGITNSVFFIKE